MRPRLFAAEILSHILRLHCGYLASMRPRLFAAEIDGPAIEWADGGRASMRPRLFAAEILSHILRLHCGYLASMRPRLFAAEISTAMKEVRGAVELQ